MSHPSAIEHNPPAGESRINRAAQHATTKRLYSVEEFRAAYGLSRARTYEEINDGRLIARRLGGRTFIADCDAEAWKNALPTHRPSRVQRAA